MFLFWALLIANVAFAQKGKGQGGKGKGGGKGNGGTPDDVAVALGGGNGGSNHHGGGHHGGGHHGGNGRGGRGCAATFTETEQDDDLKAMMLPFESGSASTTSCVLRLHAFWPHNSGDDIAVEQFGQRRLLHRSRRDSNKVAFNITGQTISDLVQRNESIDGCLAGSVDLKVANIQYNLLEESTTVLLGGQRRALHQNNDDTPRSNATVTLTQINTATDGSQVSFDLTVECKVDYDRDDTDTCIAAGLRCRHGSYTYAISETETVDREFRMRCDSDGIRHVDLTACTPTTTTTTTTITTTTTLVNF